MQQNLPLSFLIGDREGSETDWRVAMPVNMVGITRNLLGTDGYMLQMPGLTLHANAVGATRGSTWNSKFNEHFRVQAGKLVTIDSDGVVTEIGDIGGGYKDRAVMPYSFKTQCVIADKRMYLYSPDDGLTRVTDPDLGEVLDGVWIAGYYVLTDGVFLYSTNISDEKSINQNDFEEPDYSPDGIKGLLVTDDERIMVFGRYSTDYYSNAGTVEGFPFRRSVGRSSKVGIVGTHCKCKSKGVYYVLGGRINEDITVLAVQVGSAVEVASREVSKIVSEYTEAELQDVMMESRTDEKKEYVIVHLPRHTLQYDATLAQTVSPDMAWTILKSDVEGNDVWRAEYGVFDPRVGRWLFVDKLSDKVGILDPTVSTQYGEIIEWELFTKIYDIETKSIDELSVEVVAGYTVEKDATVAVSMSYNGVEYTEEYWLSYGQPSEYDNRFIVHRLGYIRNLVSFKLRGASRSRIAFSKGQLVVS